MTKYFLKAILLFSFCILEGQTIIVTGGAGFIGSNLCKRLIKEKNFVICIDDLSSGSKRILKILNQMITFSLLSMMCQSLLK